MTFVQFKSRLLPPLPQTAAGGDDEEGDGEDRLHRLSARRSDPTRAGSVRRTVPSVKVKYQVNQGQGMMDAVGEVNHRVRKDELRPQSFHDLLAVQVKAATCRVKETLGRIGIHPLHRSPC